MPLGLRNTIQTYQRLMDDILRDLDSWFPYFEDIMGLPKTPEEYDQDPRTQLLQQKAYPVFITPLNMSSSPPSNLSWLPSHRRRIPSNVRACRAWATLPPHKNIGKLGYAEFVLALPALRSAQWGIATRHTFRSECDEISPDHPDTRFWHGFRCLQGYSSTCHLVSTPQLLNTTPIRYRYPNVQWIT